MRKNILKYQVHQFYQFLREGMPVMIFVMLVFFGAAILGFQADNKRLLEDTRATVKNTEVIVDKQDETLEAIKALSLDNKLTSQQLGDTIICMLLVPVGQRTTQTQEDCKVQAINNNPASDVNGSTPTQPVPEPNLAPQANDNTEPGPDTTPPLEASPGPLESLWEIITQPVRDLVSLVRSWHGSTTS